MKNTVSSLLKMVKAHRYTYHNIFQNQKEYFQRRYDYLKSHKDKQVSNAYVEMAKREMDKVELDIVKRAKAIEILSLGIIH